MYDHAVYPAHFSDKRVWALESTRMLIALLIEIEGQSAAAMVHHLAFRGCEGFQKVYGSARSPFSYPAEFRDYALDLRPGRRALVRRRPS